MMDGEGDEDVEDQHEQEFLFFASGVYLILVGIAGAAFNLRALTKAKRVSLENDKLHNIGTSLIY